VTGEQWELLEALLRREGKPGRKHGPDLRRVVDGMLYLAHTASEDATVAA
jgi:transposase